MHIYKSIYRYICTYAICIHNGARVSMYFNITSLRPLCDLIRKAKRETVGRTYFHCSMKLLCIYRYYCSYHFYLRQQHTSCTLYNTMYVACKVELPLVNICLMKCAQFASDQQLHGSALKDCTTKKRIISL